MLIGDVRGMGAMIGIEFVKDRASKEPAHDCRERFIELCFENGLLVLGAGPSSIRLAPPLILTADEIQTGLAIMRNALESLH